MSPFEELARREGGGLMHRNDVVIKALVFLLDEFLEEMGAKYARYIEYVSREKDQLLREAFEEEKERLASKVCKAKALLKVLKIVED